MTPCPNKDRCCCNCRYHVEDFYHCSATQGTEAESLRTMSGKCVCNQHRGWICIGMLVQGGNAHSGWSEHGMCEIHDWKSK